MNDAHQLFEKAVAIKPGLDRAWYGMGLAHAVQGRHDKAAEALQRAYALLASLPEIRPDAAEEPLRALADELQIKAGQLFGLLRVAVTGRSVSPPLLESMEVIGKDTVLGRLKNAYEILERQAMP